MNNIVLAIIFSFCINHTLYAQHNAKIESLKFDNFHKSNFGLPNKTLIAENKISAIEEYHIASYGPYWVSHHEWMLDEDESKRDTTYSATYVFDKETYHLIKLQTKYDSTLYHFNGDRKTTAVVFHSKDNYFYKKNGKTTTYKYFSSFPIMESFNEDSSYTKYIFNTDSLLMREERYDNANILTAYVEYKYYKDYIEKEYWSTSSEGEIPSSRTYYYFTPDGGILTTSLTHYMGQRLMSNVSLELFNEAGFITEKVTYGDFRQFRTKYYYDDKGLLILKKHFRDDALRSETLYKYITH